MVNLFRLLGLPDPSKSAEQVKRPPRSADPGPQNNDSFHDLGKEIWVERTHKLIAPADRFVHYIKPDDLHSLNLDGMSHNLAKGNLVIADLLSLTHMQSQQDVCRRKIQTLGQQTGLPVFALNESDTLLMIAGRNMRVDTEKHLLGMAKWGQLTEEDSQ